MNAPFGREAFRRGPRRERPRLGDVLRDHDWIRSLDLERALRAQRETPFRLGQLVTVRGLSSETSVSSALAEQRGLGFVDLVRNPPDPALLDPAEVEVYLSEGIVPWRRVGRVTTYALVDPERTAQALRRLRERPVLVCVVVVTRRALEAEVARLLRPALVARASTRTSEDRSVRSIDGLRRTMVATMLVIVVALALGGTVPAVIGLTALFAMNAATTALRIGALLAGGGKPAAVPVPQVRGRLSARRPPPMMSLLVPLYREAHMLPELVRALEALDYPREHLEVRLLMEEADAETRAAAAAADLPCWILPMVVPDGQPRTKPRALNYALDFCRGEIVGILDAEDRPDPGQLRAVADAIRESAPSVACVQCQLSYHNANQNWISRCFQIEYSIWFEVLLRGFQTLRLPIPLGGTSVYFRRSALRALGGWDAHNVTEDADLGMRMCRMGMTCRVLRSTTLEEANCHLWPWVRQRSRWLKGYLMTWLSHMRDPVRLWREMGPRGFFGLNLLFLGAAASYMAMPLFWGALVTWLVTGEGLWSETVPAWIGWPAAVSLAIGQGVMLACALLATRRRGCRGLILWIPVLPVYWTLGALAAWKAVFELAVAPFWWDKTLHGISGTVPCTRPMPENSDVGTGISDRTVDIPFSGSAQT
jgi:cellulose synthase/poly-beta-1,6-N-acetylglucosamine synthase-like glycosyltransferase